MEKDVVSVLGLLRDFAEMAEKEIEWWDSPNLKAYFEGKRDAYLKAFDSLQVKLWENGVVV